MLDINDIDLEEKKKIEAAEELFREAREKDMEKKQFKMRQKELEQMQSSDFTGFILKHVPYYVLYFVGSFIFIYLGGDYLGLGRSYHISTSRGYGVALRLLPSIIVAVIVTGIALYKDIKHYKWVEKDKKERGIK